MPPARSWPASPRAVHRSTVSRCVWSSTRAMSTSSARRPPSESPDLRLLATRAPLLIGVGPVAVGRWGQCTVRRQQSGPHPTTRVTRPHASASGARRRRASPSVLPRSGAAHGLAEVRRVEGLGKDVGHRHDAFRGPDEQIESTVLPQQLAAPTTRHNRRAVGVDADEGEESASPAGDQIADETALRTQGDAVGGVLHIAATHHTPVGARPAAPTR